MTRTSKTMLNNSDNSGHLGLVLSRREKAFDKI